MNQKLLVLGVGGILLLVGAGCNRGADTAMVNTKPAENVAVPTSTPMMATTTEKMEIATSSMKAVDSLELSGKSLGNKMVQFNWKLPEGAKDPTAFHLVRGQNENPTQPPGYWFMQPGKSRATVWVKLPSGEQHFRICVWEGGKCGVYSNDVMVDVE